MIITSDHYEYAAFVKARLSEQFLMSDLVPLHKFHGTGVSSTSVDMALATAEVT